MSEAVEQNSPQLFSHYIRSYRGFLFSCTITLVICMVVLISRWDVIQAWFHGHRASAPVFSAGCVLVSIVMMTIPIQLWLLYKKLHSIFQFKTKRDLELETLDEE